MQFRTAKARLKAGEARILIVQERGEQLEAEYGIPGKRLERVSLTIDSSEGSSLKVSFRTRAGITVSLSLIQEDLLSGVRTQPGTHSSDRPIQLLRKK